MRPVPSILFALVLAAYPVLVYVGLDRLDAAAVGWLVAALGGCRLLLLLSHAQGRRDRKSLVIALLLVAVGILYAVTHYEPALRFYPVLINAFMLVLFGFSLRHPPTVIEHLARLRTPDLPASVSRYLRRVTVAWCCFFLLNGTAALITALWCSREVWTLYNGLIAYILMGAMFVGEYGIRLMVRHRHRQAADPEAGP